MLTPDKLNELAMNYDPFPALEAINQAAGIGTNFVTVPGPAGVPPAPVPGSMSPFTSMINPQQQQAPASQMAPLDPKSLALLGSMQPQAERNPSPVAPPAPGRAVQLQPFAQTPVVARKPTLAELIGR